MFLEKTEKIFFEKSKIDNFLKWMRKNERKRP
jgi:hypothetical protein